jgi:hypothetical protein
MFESDVNQFLLAAPMKPEILGKDAWPVAAAPPSRMSAAHRDCVLSANTNLTKAVEMGKRIYEKARDDHVSFLTIIKQGAAALTGARKEKAKAEADLKKSQATAAAAPDCGILKIEKAHAEEKAQELTKTKEKNEKTIDKLEKKVEVLEKELKKVRTSLTDSTGDVAVEAHCKKKEIDLEAHTLKLEAEERIQDKKEARKMKTKSRRFEDAETLYKSGGSFNGRLGGYFGNGRRGRSYDRSRRSRSRSRSFSHDRSRGRSRHSRSRSRSRNRSHRSRPRSFSVDKSRG